MVLFLLKVFRKINRSYSLATLKFKLFCYRRLSNGRFDIHSSLKAGKGFSIKFDLSPTFILLSNNITFRDDATIVIGHSGKIIIGAKCFFNNRCSINCFGNIEIGNNNQFGENVLIYDHNHQFKDDSKLISDQGYNIGKITIGNNCWLGSNVTILKDVTIGDNSIIGAGCILHKPVPPGSVVINHQNLIIKSRK